MAFSKTEQTALMPNQKFPRATRKVLSDSHTRDVLILTVFSLSDSSISISSASKKKNLQWVKETLAFVAAFPS
jgi:hypothetical protein